MLTRVLRHPILYAVLFLIFESPRIYAQPGASLSELTSATQAAAYSPSHWARTAATIEKRSLRRMGAVGNRGLASIGATMVLSSPELLWQNVDRFAVGAKLDDPVTLMLGSKNLHNKTTGWVSEKSILKYGGDFEAYWKNTETVRGNFFESQSVIQANASLKKTGSLDRFAVTAVEGKPHHPADVVRWRKGRIIERFQLKSTRNIETLYGAVRDARYKGMTIVGHSETIEALRDNIKKKKLQMKRGEPLPSKWADAEKALDNGWLTDELVAGKKVDGLEVTSKHAKKVKWWQWKKVVAGKSGKYKTAVLEATKISKAAARAGILSAKVFKHSFIALEVVAFPADLAFAGYGYYDSINRYNAGALDQDLFVTKMAIHTTEAALGAVGVYLFYVGVWLEATPEPTGATKIAGIFVLAASAVVIVADYAVDSIAGERDRQLQKTLEYLSNKERYEVLHDQITERLQLVVSGN